MTLQSVIKAIKTICLAHSQIQTVYVGLKTDGFNDRTTKFPAAQILYSAGSANLTGNQSRVDFEIILQDQVHQAREAKENELDVQSDMYSVCLDLITQLSSWYFDEWRISQDIPIDLLYETEASMCAGAQFTFSVNIPLARDLCAIPSTADLVSIAEQLQK